MNSNLNPEAPEFVPPTSVTIQAGFNISQSSIQSSNQLPSGTSYNTFKTYINFNKITSKLSENVIEQSNKLLSTEPVEVKLRWSEHEYSTDKLIEANDNFVDRVNTNMDVVVGVAKPTDFSLDGKSDRIVVASWNHNPVIAKSQVANATFIGAKSIPRPQLLFKDPVDNSETLFVPKISDKPNSIKPLSLQILYNDEGLAVGYEHPYHVELDLYHPPKEFLQACPEPPKFPPPLEETTFTYIETEAQLDKLVNHLLTVKELAVDVEHHSYRTYEGITCLIQLTTDKGGDFIIDTLAVREHLHKLNVIFTDPKKLKVFHGAEMDVIWLQRDFGVYIVGLFDTHQAAKKLKLTGLSLKYLLKRYCQVDADKKYQLADWRIRPLPEELIKYARLDTHCLLYVWRRLKAQLLEEGEQDLADVFEQSRLVCGATYNKKVLQEGSHIPLYYKSRKNFNSRQMAALKLLYQWREEHARKLDESTAYILPNHMLLSLAEAIPRELQGVNACCSPMPPFVKENLIPLHKILLSCRQLPLEPQLYQMPLSISTMMNHQHTTNFSFHDLDKYPDFRDDYPRVETHEESDQSFEDEFQYYADVEAIDSSINKDLNNTVVSELNVNAKAFVPPFDRYKKYRTLAQIEEMAAFKEKEAKVAALEKDNELKKTEVLLKTSILPKLKEQTPSQETTVKEPEVISDSESTEIKKAGKRKRKMSNEKPAPVKPLEMIRANMKKGPANVFLVPAPPPPLKASVKTYEYTKANYKKFFNESHKGNGKLKSKFNKNKK